MARKLDRVTLSSCLVLCLTSCTSAVSGTGQIGQNEQYASMAMGPRFVGPGVKLENCPPNLSYNTVVRVKLPESVLDLPQRLVKHSTLDTDPIKIDEEDSYDKSVYVNNTDTKYKQNPFHIDLQRVAAANPADQSPYFKVTVFIKNKNLKFWQSPLTNAVGIERLKPNPDVFAGILCKTDEDPNDAQKKRPVLTFFVKRAIGRSVEIPINLLVVGKNGTIGDDTPIIIDPKIKNDG